MSYTLKAWDIVGYTGDANYWCIRCAGEQYGRDDEGIIDAHDSEGNVVFPVFASDECADDECGHCGREMTGEGS